MKITLDLNSDTIDRLKSGSGSAQSNEILGMDLQEAWERANTLRAGMNAKQRAKLDKAIAGAKHLRKKN